jgi:hypothetical protein
MQIISGDLTVEGNGSSVLKVTISEVGNMYIGSATVYVNGTAIGSPPASMDQPPGNIVLNVQPGQQTTLVLVIPNGTIPIQPGRIYSVIVYAWLGAPGGPAHGGGPDTIEIIATMTQSSTASQSLTSPLVTKVTKTDGLMSFTVELSSIVVARGQMITVRSYLTNVAGKNVTIGLVESSLAGLQVVSSNGTVVWGYYPPAVTFFRNVTKGETIQGQLEIPTSGLQSGQVYAIVTGPGFYYATTQAGQTGLDFSISFMVR